MPRGKKKVTEPDNTRIHTRMPGWNPVPVRNAATLSLSFEEFAQAVYASWPEYGGTLREQFVRHGQGLCSGSTDPMVGEANRRLLAQVESIGGDGERVKYHTHWFSLALVGNLHIEDWDEWMLQSASDCRVRIAGMHIRG